MHEKIYYLHPAKCGGTAVEHCLNTLEVKYLYTSNIALTHDMLQILLDSKKLILFGHINYIPDPLNNDESVIKKLILRSIYSDFNLIMPTRNPANLVQSWMHYDNKRINDFFRDNRQVQVLPEKILSACSRILALKYISDKPRLRISDLSNGSRIELDKNDEEQNLMFYINLLTRSTAEISQLASMEMQLMYLQWKTIKDCIRKGKAYGITPPRSNNKRFVFYYDCENITSSVSHTLDMFVDSRFSQALLTNRCNSSKAADYPKAQNINSVSEYLKELVPNEWFIHGLSSVSC